MQPIPGRMPHDVADPFGTARPRRGAAPGAGGAFPAAASERAVRVAHVRVAGAAKDQARPRAVVRRHRVPDHVHADVHVPVRRRPGRLDRRVPAVPAARILVQTVVFITIYTGFTLNTDITKGVFDRFRSLPIWRPSVLLGALLGDAARYTMAS